MEFVKSAAKDRKGHFEDEKLPSVYFDVKSDICSAAQWVLLLPCCTHSGINVHGDDATVSMVM